MMQTKEYFLAALDSLEANMKDAFGSMSGDAASGAGHHREFDMSIMRLEESLMWMRRSIERMFA